MQVGSRSGAPPVFERRATQRGRTLLGGKVIFNGGRSAIDCIVRNMSEDGVCVQVESPVGIPDQVLLTITGESEPRNCAVAWQSSNRLGLTFHRADATAEDSAGSDVERDIDELLEDTQRERDEYLELAKRTRADFENYRRRAAEEVREAERRGKTSLARELIPSLDNLERALHGIDPDSDDDGEGNGDGGGLAHGVRLVYREIRSTL